MENIFNAYEIGVYRYSEARVLANALGFTDYAKTVLSLSVVLDGERFALINNKCDPIERSFGLVHEMGRLLLGHLTERLYELSTEQLEAEANVFAAVMAEK